MNEQKNKKRGLVVLLLLFLVLLSTVSYAMYRHLQSGPLSVDEQGSMPSETLVESGSNLGDKVISETRVSSKPNETTSESSKSSEESKKPTVVPQPTTAGGSKPSTALKPVPKPVVPSTTQPNRVPDLEIKPVEPKPTEPKPTEPKPTEPKPMEPKPTEPKSVEPKPTEPKPAPDTRVAEAKKAIELASKAKETYREKFLELNQDHLISPAEKQIVDQLKEAYEQAKTVALEKIEAARTAPDFNTLDTSVLTDVPEIIVNDRDDNKKADDDEIDAALEKVNTALTAKQAYDSFYKTAVQDQNGAVSQADIDRLTTLKTDYETAKQSADTAYNALASVNQTSDLSTEHQKLTAIDNLPTAVNDANDNGILDSVEAEQAEAEKTRTARASVEEAERLKGEYEALLNTLVQNDGNSVSPADVRALTEKKQAYDTAKAGANTAVQALAQDNAERAGLVTRVGALTEVNVPQANDRDDNKKLDAEEIRAALEKVNTALTAKQAYDSFYKTAVQDQNGAVSQADIDRLTTLKTAYETAKQSADTAYNALASVNQTSDLSTEHQKLTAIDNLPTAVNDANDNGILDSVEAEQAEAEKTRTARSSVEEAERLKNEYQALLRELVINDGNSVSPADVTALTEKKQAYDTAKAGANTAVQALAQNNAERAGLVTRVGALTEVNVPQANDRDDNKKLDEEEIRAALEKVNTALTAKQAYDSFYKTAVQDQNGAVSQADIDRLTTLKTAYETAKQSADTAYTALASVNQTSDLSTEHQKLTAIDNLPTAVNDANDNGILDSVEAEQAEAEKTRTARASVEEAERLKNEYQALLRELVINDGNSVSPADVTALTEKKQEYDLAKRTARNQIQTLAQDNASRPALQQRLNALTEFALPEANDRDGNHRLDQTEIHAVRLALTKALEAKTAYETEYRTLVTDDPQGTSEADLERLTTLKNTYDQLKNSAKPLYEALAPVNQTGLTTQYDALSELTLPSLTPAKANKDKLRTLYDSVQTVKTQEKYLYDTQEDKTAFDQAFAQAKTVLDDEDAQADAIEDAYNALKTAFEHLDGILEKRVEFRNVTATHLYRVSPEGAMERVTGLATQPNDLENYLAVFEQDGDKVYMPVHSITEENDQFKVVVKHPELHTYAHSNYTEDRSFKLDKIRQGNNVFTQFDALLNAMRNKPDGTYLIGSDILATPAQGNFYVQEFRGTLKSVDGKKYALLNLTKPLFNILKGRVENMSFKQVNITSTDSVGTVAIEMKDNALIKNLYVEGKVTYDPNHVSSKFIGGVVGTLFQNTVMENVWAKVQLTAKDQANGQRVGLLAGRSAFGVLRNNYAEGHIELTGVSGSVKSNVGRIMGYSYSANVNNTLLKVSHNAALNQAIRDIADNRGTLNNTYTVVENASGNNQITEAQALEKLRAWNYFFEPSEADDSSSETSGAVNYAELPNYEAERATAYHNTEKLLPFYDRHTILKYGNAIEAGTALYQKNIKHLAWMQDNQFTSNVYDKEHINKLFVLYADDTFETFALSPKGLYKNTGIMEYDFGNGLLFTPKQFIQDASALWSSLGNSYQTVQLDNEAVRRILKLDAYNTTTNYNFTVADLYLNEAFADIQQNLESNLKSLVAQTWIGDMSSPALKRHAEYSLNQNKEAVLLGLSYLNRLYNVRFGDYNIKPLMLFDQAFYQNQVSQLEQLKNIGQAGFEKLFLHQNANLFESHMNNLGKGNLVQFLEKNRTLFLPQVDENTWFKSSTAAFTHEQSSTLFPDLSVALYPRLKADVRGKNYILPLLNLKEDNIYVLSAPATLYFGGYGRSIDQALLNDQENYRAKVEEVHALIRERAKDYTKFIEFLYKLSDENQRNFLSQNLTQVFDGYYIWDSQNGTPVEIFANQPRRWATKYDTQYTAIKDFFGPIGRYYQPFSNKPDAYVNRANRIMHFDHADLLSHAGPSVLSHELVHAYDEPIILGNHAYREGQDTESYAMGLFESVTSENSYYYGFNFMYDFKYAAPYNHNISRFLGNTKEELQQYMHGVFDVTYLLNGVEAEIITAKPKADQKYFYNKIRLDQSEASQVVKGMTYHHGNDVIETISDSEWQTMNLSGINDLIDNNLVNNTSLLAPKTYARDNNNNYHYVPLFHPIYAAYQNPQGTVGGLTFKLYALELLAEYGWDRGFVPYASNQYQAQAHGEGQALSDTYIFNKIFGGTYADYKAFKKAMYAERMAKKDRIKRISVSYQNQTHVIETYDDLKQLLQRAVDADLEKLKLGRRDIFERQNLKNEIIKAYNALTQDFTSSIFND